MFICVVLTVYVKHMRYTIVTLRHKLIYLPTTRSATLTHQRARVTEQAFNCNIRNVRRYNAPRIVLHCSAFGECSTARNIRRAIVLHCSTFAKCSTEPNNAEQCNPDCFTRYAIVLHSPNVVPSRAIGNNAIPIVSLGMQLFYICQMPNNEMQRYAIPPPVNDLPGSVIIIHSTHTGATPPPPLAIHTPNNVKKI